MELQHSRRQATARGRRSPRDREEVTDCDDRTCWEWRPWALLSRWRGGTRAPAQTNRDSRRTRVVGRGRGRREEEDVVVGCLRAAPLPRSSLASSSAARHPRRAVTRRITGAGAAWRPRAAGKLDQKSLPLSLRDAGLPAHALDSLAHDGARPMPVTFEVLVRREGRTRSHVTHHGWWVLPSRQQQALSAGDGAARATRSWKIRSSRG